MTLSLETKPKGIGRLGLHMSQPAAEGQIKLIKHVMAAVSDQVQIDLIAMFKIGRVGRLIGKIKMKLMATQPGKGEDLLPQCLNARLRIRTQ